jgi:hypothetical protein
MHCSDAVLAFFFSSQPRHRNACGLGKMNCALEPIRDRRAFEKIQRTKESGKVGGRGRSNTPQFSSLSPISEPKSLYRVLYMRFWAHQNEVQKVDCIDLWWCVVLFFVRGRRLIWQSFPSVAQATVTWLSDSLSCIKGRARLTRVRIMLAKVNWRWALRSRKINITVL